MTRPWGGLVPDDSSGPADAREEAARAQAAPTGTEPAAAAPMTAADEALSHARGAEAMLAELLHLERRRDRPAQIYPLTFNGGEGIYVVTSRHPPRALSLGVVNPFEGIVYVGLDGGRAAPNSSAFMVPAKSAIVIPVAADKVDLGMDPAVLKAETATIHLLRFASVQPFFLGKIG